VDAFRSTNNLLLPQIGLPNKVSTLTRAAIPKLRTNNLT